MSHDVRNFAAHEKFSDAISIMLRARFVNGRSGVRCFIGGERIRGDNERAKRNGQRNAKEFLWHGEIVSGNRFDFNGGNGDF
jgi:hypothetical protein